MADSSASPEPGPQENHEPSKSQIRDFERNYVKQRLSVQAPPHSLY